MLRQKNIEINDVAKLARGVRALQKRGERRLDLSLLPQLRNI